jgi:glycosyltransferase involved in cell wall biosynthesis
MSELAIVIPAYKSMFFDQVLLSIANQTNKEFTLYIGDDCSPDNLYSIVKKYENRIPIIYKHFDENLGGNDLVAQWERCIDLVGDEEWIWLFSDDDIMGITCVESFYRSVTHQPDFDLFHFNVLKIDQYENIIENFYDFPEILTSEEFLLKKLRIGYFSTVVEYIFRKSHFYEQGRFQKFDLAWCSDDATWIKLSKKKGIRNIEDSTVYWRKSLFNISSINQDKEILIRKFNSQIEFANWIFEESKYGKIEISTLQKKVEIWFMGTIKSRIENLSYGIIATLLKRLNLVFGKKKYPKQKILILYIYKIQRSFIGILKIILFHKHFNSERKKFQTFYSTSNKIL